MRDKLVDRTATYPLGKVLKLDRWAYRTLTPHRYRWGVFRSPMEYYYKENITIRNIQELLQGGKKVWFFLKDQETEHRFVEEINQLGARYLNGSPVTAETCSPIMAVHPDLRVAHLMIMIWNASFSPSFDQHYVGDASKILKVDYAKFIAGHEEYLCTKSEFTPII